jgi:hypothetical protein
MPEPVRNPVRPQGAQVYQLKRPLAELPENLRLRNQEWGVLFAVTGEHSCAQIATLLRMTPEERDRVFGRLAAIGLIEERPLSYGEYLRALASWRDDEPKPLAAFLRGGAAMAPAGGAAPIPPVGKRPAPPPPPPVVTADSDLNITRALPTFDRRQVVAAGEPPIPAFLPLEPIAPAAAAAPRPEAAPPDAARKKTLSLKALMQLILGRAGDPQSGQLDVYRVFIRVNTKLLQKNGITTLRFQEDRLIEDPELQHALVASFEKALGVPCPPEVFVGGPA